MAQTNKDDEYEIGEIQIFENDDGGWLDLSKWMIFCIYIIAICVFPFYAVGRICHYIGKKVVKLSSRG